MKKHTVLILMVLCNLFWAGNYVFGKFVVAEMTPVWITFLRWLMASIILLAVSRVIEKPDWRLIIKEWPIWVAMSILGIVLYTLILYTALDYTSSTNAALVNALNPGMIVVFSAFFLRERISNTQIMGIVASLLGVLVILTNGDLGQIFQMEYNKGDLLMLGAIFVWTIYSIIGKRMKLTPPITATAAASAIAAMILAPFALYQGIDLESISPLAWTGMAYITIFPSVFSYVFWNMGVKELGANKTGIFLNLIPVFTAIISWILGNRVTGAQIIGGLLVFAGVYITTGMLDKRLAKGM